jgi:FAD/FMN-containing dehydrogenase
MKRRDFLQYGLSAAASLYGAGRRPPQAVSHGVGRLTGRVVLPGQTDYETARQDRNPRISCSPAVIVFCRNATDVGHAIRWSKNHHAPLRVRCGGHSYEGYSVLDDGIVVDVSEMRQLHLDPTRQIVRVGAGLMLGEIAEALAARGFAIPTGSCPTVGIAGSTLGGGYGLLARARGLSCDSLLEVEIVTADGRTLRANAREHSDLFWACRGGGGGNFGVATGFTFRVSPISRVAVCQIVWDWSDLAAVLNAWQAWGPTTDERLTSVLKLPALANGTVSCGCQYLGTESALSALLQPLHLAAPPRTVTVRTVDYAHAMRIFGGSHPDFAEWHIHPQTAKISFKNSSDYADRPLDADGIAVLKHFLETAPASSNLVQLEAYGGAINRLAPDATAFPHRAGTLFNMQYQAYWKQSSAGPAQIDWIAQFRHAMQPYVSGRAYSNYCDAAISDWPQAYYGANLARLMRIKAKYDPGNFFNFPQSIPLKQL